MILGIYGAGGLGREIHVIAKKINSIEHRWEKIVFIDDNTKLNKVNGIEVYGFSKVIEEYTVMEVVIGVGEPSIRELLYKKIKENHIKITSIIHPGIYIDETIAIGEGVVICEGVVMSCNISIGNNVYLQPKAVIGHDIKIGDHSMIGVNCQIGGANQIGKRVYMGFLSGTKESLSIGNDVICSAGAIVFRNLPDEVIVVGNPARIMKKNEDKKVFK